MCRVYFVYPTKRGPRLIRICRAASPVSLASMIVVSSGASCTFSRSDAVDRLQRLSTTQNIRRRPRGYTLKVPFTSLAPPSADTNSSLLMLIAICPATG
jgi:hypothetical protein